MSSTTPSEGFFSKTGTLEARPTRDTSDAETNKTAPSTDSKSDTTAAKIADDAVYTTTKKLNVGGTGFDQGVKEQVEAAVSDSLKRRDSAKEVSAAAESKPAERKSVGGTYQNEIIAKAKAAKKAAEAKDPPPAVEEPPKEAAPPPRPPSSPPANNDKVETAPAPRPTPTRPPERKEKFEKRSDKGREEAHRQTSEREGRKIDHSEQREQRQERKIAKTQEEPQRAYIAPEPKPNRKVDKEV